MGAERCSDVNNNVNNHSEGRLEDRSNPMRSIARLQLLHHLNNSPHRIIKNRKEALNSKRILPRKPKKRLARRKNKRRAIISRYLNHLDRRHDLVKLFRKGLSFLERLVKTASLLGHVPQSLVRNHGEKLF